MAPLLMMAEHHEAYFAWKRAGVKDAWCWHVDAHLDVGTDGLGEDRLLQLRSCSHEQQAQQRGLCGNAYLPWGGLHCGNYLLPSLREGLVGRLTWVLPSWLVRQPLLPWARLHLQGWLDLRLDDYASLQDRGGYIEGVLEGVPFQMGCQENLPAPDRPVLLDIDLDFFLTEAGEVWLQPDGFPRPESQFTTLALSVSGGYTPESQLGLAEPFGRGFPRPSEGPLDLASRWIRVGRYAEAQAWLEKHSAAPVVERNYLLGTCLQQQKHYSEALGLWQELLKFPLPYDGRAYVLGLCAECLSALQRPGEALQCLSQVELPDYRCLWAMSRLYEELEQGRAAAQALRRASTLAEGRLFSLQIRYQLACLYRKQGKEGLARMELAALEQLDRTGELRSLTLLR